MAWSSLARPADDPADQPGDPDKAAWAQPVRPGGRESPFGAAASPPRDRRIRHARHYCCEDDRRPGPQPGVSRRSGGRRLGPAPAPRDEGRPGKGTGRVRTLDGHQDGRGRSRVRRTGLAESVLESLARVVFKRLRSAAARATGLGRRARSRRPGGLSCGGSSGQWRKSTDG